MHDGKQPITANASSAESGTHGGTFCPAYSSCVTHPAQHMELVGFIVFIRIENKTREEGSVESKSNLSRLCLK